MEHVKVENFKLGDPPLYDNTFEYVCPKCGKRNIENRVGEHPLPSTDVKCKCGFEGHAVMPWLR
jgi:DNA-directed RNA polymerase subunit RPC12/RpoP